MDKGWLKHLQDWFEDDEKFGRLLLIACFVFVLAGVAAQYL